MVPMRFSCRDALSDIQHDLSGSPRDLDHVIKPRSPDLTWPWLEVKFDINFFRSACMYSDASRRQEHDDIRIWFLAFLVQTLFARNIFVYFDLSWNLKPNPLKMGQFWRHASEKSSKAIDCIFLRLPTLNSFWDNSTFPKKYGISLNLTFDDLWRPQSWPERKHDRSNFEMFFDDLLNFFPFCATTPRTRVSWGEGGV